MASCFYTTAKLSRSRSRSFLLSSSNFSYTFHVRLFRCKIFLFWFWIKTYVRSPPCSKNLSQCNACTEHLSNPGKEDVKGQLRHFGNDFTWTSVLIELNSFTDNLMPLRLFYCEIPSRVYNEYLVQRSVRKWGLRRSCNDYFLVLLHSTTLSFNSPMLFLLSELRRLINRVKTERDSNSQQKLL